jgi:hypothetical protein
MELVLRALKPYLKSNSLGFLDERDYPAKMEELVAEKLKRSSGTSIVKKLAEGTSLKIDKLPLTGYNFYAPYFKDPHEGDFMYSLEEYIKVFTSGTMSKPKGYLMPKAGITHNMRNTGLTHMFLATHDGEKMTFDVGDVTYANTPGGAFISGFMHDTSKSVASGWVKKVPPDDMSFDEKVDYFVTHYKEIDMAYMNVPLLLEEIYPRIGEPFHLKGFYTQDQSAGVLKDRIKKVTGGYPKTIYGSTETMFIGLPSIEHPGAFFLDWRVVYPEFIPETEAIEGDVVALNEHPETVPMSAVEVGKRYQLVATPIMNDLTRYVMPDLLECVDTGDDILGSSIPAFKYFARCDRLVMLHNFTRISEEELVEVMTRAGVPFVDFTARREADGSHDYMALYVETSKQVDAEEVKKRIQEELLAFDKDWRDLTNYLKYEPLKLIILPKGTFKKYLSRRAGLPKVDRVEMRDELLKTFLGSG